MQTLPEHHQLQHQRQQPPLHLRRALERLWDSVDSLRRRQPPPDATNYDEVPRLELIYVLADALATSLRLAFVHGFPEALDDAVARRRIDELIWALAFRPRIDAMRSRVAQARSKASAESAVRALRDFLDRAAVFFRVLIQEVTVYCSCTSKAASPARVVAFDPAANTARLYLARDESWNAFAKEFEPMLTSVEAKALARLLQRLLFALYVYLGDIERYRETYSAEGKDKGFVEPISLYQHAILIDPDQGKPASQLAIVHQSKGQNFEALYYYSLSISSLYSPTIAKDNFTIFHEKVLSHLPQVSATGFTDLDLETVKMAIMQFHQAYLFHPNTSSLLGWELSSAIAMHDNICGWFDKALSFEEIETPDEAPDTDAISKMVDDSVLDTLSKFHVILVSSYTELGALFVKKDTTAQERQRIREVQCIIASYVFRTTAAIFFRARADETVEVVSSETETAQLLRVSGFSCAWLARMLSVSTPRAATAATNVFEIFQKYAGSALAGAGTSAGRGLRTQPSTMAGISRSLAVFARALAALANTCLSYEYDDSDDGEDAESPTGYLKGDEVAAMVLAEDLELLGFAPVREYFATKFSLWSLTRAVERASTRFHSNAASELGELESDNEARLARVLGLAKLLATSRGVEFFGFEDARGDTPAHFVVTDEESKRIARTKTAKTLALQLLKAEISNLESQVVENSESSAVVYIPDTRVFTDHLDDIKAMFKKRAAAGSSSRVPGGAYHLLVALDVIRELDALKTGPDGVHTRARVATRFLESRLRGLGGGGDGGVVLRTQQSAETAAKTGGNLAGYVHWGMLGCALYEQERASAARAALQTRLGEAGIDVSAISAVDAGAGVVVVSDDESLREECASCGVAVVGVAQLRARLHLSRVRKPLRRAK
ncbi:hypothetical protein HDU84_005955 [Entophlyctis sp. JEL0112]|nr:hypothetical protein HDU84_005955 [Entophlyctis sp. JEL0112]